MPNTVTIIMYHFVRDLAHSRYPAIKGLDLNEFIEQVAYIRRFYTVITMEELIAAATSVETKKLPGNALLLTFDDGYADHFTNVFPILDKYGLQGSFFPPAKAVLEHQVLGVNKLHFILASVDDTSQLIRFIMSEIEANRSVYGLDEAEQYYQRLAIPHRYDSSEVVFIKRILQKGLPESLRAAIVDELFKKYVTRDEAAFARELYMSIEQIKCMHRNGMHIGSHGFNHYWLDTLAPDEQIKEVSRSMDFLTDLGCNPENWVICYPYGAYDQSLLTLLKDKGCSLGLTTNVAIADLDLENPLLLSRLDANDLPKQAQAQPNEWTRRIIEKGKQ